MCEERRDTLPPGPDVTSSGNGKEQGERFRAELSKELLVFYEVPTRFSPIKFIRVLTYKDVRLIYPVVTLLIICSRSSS